jgi:hypothetical protein
MAVLDDRKVRSNEKAGSDVVGIWEVGNNSPNLVKATEGYQKEGKIFVAYEGAAWALTCIVFWRSTGFPAKS